MIARLVAVLFGLAVPLGAHAVTILYNDFSDLTGLQLNGSTRTIHGCAASGDGATCSPISSSASGQDVLRLTAAQHQSGSAFSSNAISLESDASFSTKFRFQFHAPEGLTDSDGIQGADGIVFTVQTVASTAGGAGGGIGYQGLADSVGIEFDTWNNGFSFNDGNNGNHIAIGLDGVLNSTGEQANLPTATQALNNGTIYTAWIDYNGATDSLEVRFSAIDVRPLLPLLQHTVDLVAVLGSTDAFAGFTSGTGAAANDHDILSWQFVSTFAPIDQPVPAPGSAGLALLAALALVPWLRRKRRDGPDRSAP